jgi:pyrroloquinoline quinone biosynthesis protein B
MYGKVHRLVTTTSAIAAVTAGLLAGCGHERRVGQTTATGPFVVVLGTAQDGGYPQAGTKPGDAWNPDRRRLVASLALVDPVSGERWLFDATPDFKEQLHALDLIAPSKDIPGLAGIFLTHAHIGHYTGLMNLGREVIGANGVPVYAMPRMHAFLSTNGPWDQLVGLHNIDLRLISDSAPVRLNERLTVSAFRVPHRDEYSETVGYKIQGPTHTVIFIPDIDKWERWDSLGVSIEDVVAHADVAYLDGTFYADGEVPGRSMAEIPHPFIVETMRRFGPQTDAFRAKVRFIHLNRTNPAAWMGSAERGAIEHAGFRVAEILERVPL